MGFWHLGWVVANIQHLFLSRFALVASPGGFAPSGILSEHPWQQSWLFWGAGKRVKKWSVQRPLVQLPLCCWPSFDSHGTAPHGVSVPSIFILFFQRLYVFLFLFFPNGHQLSWCLMALNLVWCNLGRGGVRTPSRPVSCLEGSNLYTRNWLRGVGF